MENLGKPNDKDKPENPSRRGLFGILTGAGLAAKGVVSSKEAAAQASDRPKPKTEPNLEALSGTARLRAFMLEGPLAAESTNSLADDAIDAIKGKYDAGDTYVDKDRFDETFFANIDVGDNLLMSVAIQKPGPDSKNALDVACTLELTDWPESDILRSPKGGSPSFEREKDGMISFGSRRVLLFTVGLLEDRTGKSSMRYRVLWENGLINEGALPVERKMGEYEFAKDESLSPEERAALEKIVKGCLARVSNRG